jgi:transcriptional regulator with XRE-family HTH domain
MIKNSKQAAITKAKLDQLTQDFAKFQETQEAVLHPVRFKLGLKSFEGMIKDLSEQLAQYERVTKQPLNQFAGYKAPQLVDLLTQVRLAKDMSQKALAEKLGLQEQQIQRYEQDDYSKASWTRVLEVYYALGLEIKLAPFEVAKTRKLPTTSLKVATTRNWLSPNQTNREVVERAIRKTKNKRSLFQFA